MLKFQFSMTRALVSSLNIILSTGRLDKQRAMMLHDSFKTFVRDEYPNDEEIDAAKIVFVKFCDDLFQNEIGLNLFDVNYNHMNMLLCKRPSSR